MDVSGLLYDSKEASAAIEHASIRLPSSTITLIKSLIAQTAFPDKTHSPSVSTALVSLSAFSKFRVTDSD